MNTFVFLQQNFAKHILPNITNNAVEDCKRVFTMSHKMIKDGKEGKVPSRFTGWAMIKESKSYVQSNLALKNKKLVTGDKRTRYQAWYEELKNFTEPACFIEFTQSTLNIGSLFITYDPRVVRVCGPSRSQSFNFLEDADDSSPMVHIQLTKERNKNV